MKIEKKGSTKKGRWGNTLVSSKNGPTVLHKVLLEKVVYHQNRERDCFIASFLTVLHVVDYNKERVEDIFGILDESSDSQND
jgi:hypothetical protein